MSRSGSVRGRVPTCLCGPVCALGPSGATAGTPLLHGVSAGCDAMRCRTTDLPERTLLSWLHRVPATPCRARENRACPSDTVSPSSDIPRACTDTAARFYIVQNNMQYSDAHRRYNFVRGGLSLTRLGTLYAMYCTILLVSQYIGQQAAPLRLRPPRTHARLAQARGHERAPREPSANSDAPNRAGPLLAARRARNLGGRTL